jgi:hypothetical protein
MKIKNIFPHFCNYVLYFVKEKRKHPVPHSQIFKYFASCEINKLNHKMIMNYIYKRLKEGISPSTINQELKAFIIFFISLIIFHFKNI